MDAQNKKPIAEIMLRRFAPTIFLGITLLAISLAKQFGFDSQQANWAVLISATFASVAILKQCLPAQNIAGLAVVVAIFSGAVLFAKFFLPLKTTAPLLNKSFSELPWWIAPLLWFIALVNARGTAKFLLQKLRGTNYFGLWLIGVSSGLIVVLSRASDFSAQRIFLQWTFALLALVLTTPWFINKKPVNPPPDIQPLLVLLLILLG